VTLLAINTQHRNISHVCLQWYTSLLTIYTQAGVKLGGNAVPRPAISVIWRSKASKSTFSAGTHVTRPET